MKNSIYFLLIVSLALCNSARHSFKKIGKSWSEIQNELSKHPELADSFNLVKHDTIRVVEFKASIEASNDSLDWNSEFFDEVDTLADKVVKAGKPGKVLSGSLVLVFHRSMWDNSSYDWA